MSAQDKRDKVDASAENEELEGLLAIWRRNIELDLRVAMPGHVTAYNPTTQRATIQLGLVPVRFVEDEEVAQPPIVLPDVPVLNIGGSLGYVSFQLVPGDSGLVVFSDRCMAAWLKLGQPTDPINGRAHALGDGVFIPGVRPIADVITPPTDITGTVVEGSLVRLGSLAANGVVLDAAGLEIARAAAEAALGAFIPGSGYPPGVVVATDPTGAAAAAALNAIIPVLFAVVQAITVSTKVFAAPTP